jgi:hypothetical protein
VGRHVASIADERNGCTISTGKLLQFGGWEEEKEMEYKFSIRPYSIVYEGWK